jgi:hypothetical protein
MVIPYYIYNNNIREKNHNSTGFSQGLYHFLRKSLLKLNKFYLNKAFIDNLQRFLRSVSGTGTGRHRGLTIPALAPTGPDRHRPTSTGTGTDQPGCFMTFLIRVFKISYLFGQFNTK